MPSNASLATVLVAPRPAPHLPAAGSSSRDMPRAMTIVGSAAAAVSHRGGLRRVYAVLSGFAEIVLAGFAFPLGILAVGIPIVLLVRLAIWTVRALTGW